MNEVIELYTLIAQCFNRRDRRIPNDLRKKIEGLVESICLPEYLDIHPKLEEIDILLLSAYEAQEGGPLTDHCVDKDKLSEEFLVKAFERLSQIKNPLAMKVFNELQYSGIGYPYDLFVCASKIKRRKDGSSVVVMVVDDVKKLEKILLTHLRAGYSFGTTALMLQVP